jgi:nitrite reductase/ring-hydroxylating ferredoxin subunit
MLKKIVALFGRKPALVKGAGKLEEGQAKVVTFGDVLAGTATQVMFSRVGGELRAMNAICPHEGILMNDGPVTSEGNIVCPMHLFEFDTKTGREKGTQCKNVKIYKVREDGNDADIWL